MKLKSEAHELLSLLFQQDGVPPVITCDNAKEMILGEFNKKLKEASCHLKQMEPFAPCFNAARSWRKVPVGSSLSLAPNKDYRWLPQTWVLHKVQHCAWHLQTGCGSPWNNYVWRDLWHLPVLWDWMVLMGNALRVNCTISQWAFQTG